MPQSFADCSGLHKLWGGQSCPQPPFRRLLWPIRESSRVGKPAESRLQPGLAAPQSVQNLPLAKNFVALGFSLCRSCVTDFISLSTVAPPTDRLPPIAEPHPVSRSQLH